MQIAGSETSSFLFNEMHDHQAMMAHLHSYEAAAAAEAEAEAAPREASSNGAMPHGADSGAYVSMQCRGTSAARCVLMADAGQALSADVDGQVSST